MSFLHGVWWYVQEVCSGQHRNYGNTAQIKKTLSCIISITNLTKYEPKWKALKNQLDIPKLNSKVTDNLFSIVRTILIL